MKLFCVYENPSDHPGKWVVRARMMDQDAASTKDTDARVFDTLEDARASIPAGLMRIPPFSDDDPAIKEVWL